MEFQLRPWQKKDIESVLIYANNKKISDNLRDAFPYPYTRENAKAYVSFCMKCPMREQLLRAIIVEGRAVGNIGVVFKEDVYRKSAEVGYWLGEPFWRQGIMTRAIGQMCDFVFSNFDIVRIFAEVYAHNTPSRRVLEKNGFQLEGELQKSIYKNGGYYNSCIYGLLK